MRVVSRNSGLWSASSTPRATHKYKILRVFFQKRAIELQATAVLHLLWTREPEDVKYIRVGKEYVGCG